MAFIGYCDDCGAKHEAEEGDGCMCGGEIISRADLEDPEASEAAWQETIA